MKSICFILTLFMLTNIFSQEIVVKTKFAIRDFKINDNTIVYIEKRDIKSFNLVTKQADTIFNNNSFFIGGYGLNIFYPKDTNQVVTASNELVENRSSIRFYNTESKNVNKFQVYYTTKLMDFLLSSKEKLFFLSKKDLTIEIFRYGGKPRYQKIDSIKITSFSRKMGFFDNKLFYITDEGRLFEYNIKTQNNRLLYNGSNLLTNFVFDGEFNNIFVTTYNGNVMKINIKDPSQIKKRLIGNEIIEAIAIFDNKYLIVGDWSGKINVININSFKIDKQFNNKHRIIKIVTKDGYFYTSSSDKTIKKWKIN